MKVLLDGKNSKRAFFMCRLLGVDQDVVAIKNSQASPGHEASCYKIVSESGYFMTPEYVLSCIEKQPEFDRKEPGITIDCNRPPIMIDADVFETFFPGKEHDACSKHTLAWSIKKMYGRDAKEDEIQYHVNNNKRKIITMFEWLAILHMCPEGRSNLKDMIVKLDANPKIAVLFCGHARLFNKTSLSQKELINNPNVDVFVHVWDDLGFKNNRSMITKEWLNKNSGKTDIDAIKNLYKPKRIMVENNHSILDSFSLRGKVSPLFLFAYQARDDASRYINSQLYSIYKAYELIKEEEESQGYMYDGILKLRFDFNISNINIENIRNQVASTNALWFAHKNLCHHGHYGGGGGCVSCDKNIHHLEHTNDICDILFYGNRQLAGKACELYMHAEDIMKRYLNENISCLQKNPHIKHQRIGDIVYIERFEDIEKNFVCFYPEQMLRRHLKGIKCLSSSEICGRIAC